MSALGVVHVFQRRALVRRWHEDFPAIHTEGGTPGSESAGIVAFIRERLVDLDEDPPDATRDDDNIEPQETPKTEEVGRHHAGIPPSRSQNAPGETTPKLDRSRTPGLANNAGYIPDGIPLLDMSGGHGEGSKGLRYPAGGYSQRGANLR